MAPGREEEFKTTSYCLTAVGKIVQQWNKRVSADLENEFESVSRNNTWSSPRKWQVDYNLISNIFSLYKCTRAFIRANKSGIWDQGWNKVKWCSSNENIKVKKLQMESIISTKFDFINGLTICAGCEKEVQINVEICNKTKK